jgi:hypothetical protein
MPSSRVLPVPGVRTGSGGSSWERSASAEFRFLDDLRFVRGWMRGIGWIRLMLVVGRGNAQ